jgi:hypothetical protein
MFVEDGDYLMEVVGVTPFKGEGRWRYREPSGCSCTTEVKKREEMRGKLGKYVGHKRSTLLKLE